MRDPWQPHQLRGVTLAVVLVGTVILAALVLGRDGPGATGDADRAPQAEGRSRSVDSAPAAERPSATRARGTSTEPVVQTQVDDVTSEARSAAATAVAAWQIADTAARTAALTPLVTPEFLQAAATIDPTLVPTSPVASSSTVADSDGFARVRVTLADGTVLLVDLQLATGWLVDSILPAA